MTKRRRQRAEAVRESKFVVGKVLRGGGYASHNSEPVSQDVLNMRAKLARRAKKIKVSMPRMPWEKDA